MADGLLGLLGGGGNTGGMDLNQLVRPPDPLGDALAAMSERFATAGQASRLPTSTLGAIGSALGGASTAARASQTQYLDQAIKLQALKRSMMQMGLTEQAATRWATILADEQRKRAAGGSPGAPPVVTPAPAIAGPPVPAPTAAPGAPSITAPPLPGDFGATGEYGGGQNGLLAPPTPGSPDTVIPSTPGGPAATPASFRPAALVAPDGRSGDGAGNAGPVPLDLIARMESGGRNIRQQITPEGTASGPWQMIDSTFHETGRKAGIDTSAYTHAMDAPVEVQRAIAAKLFQDQGYKPWQSNAALMQAIGASPAVQRSSPSDLASRNIGMAPYGAGGNNPLAGLLALSGGGEDDPLAGLLATSGGKDPLAVLLGQGDSQPGPVDELIPSGNALPAGLLQRAAMTVPGKADAGYPFPNLGANTEFPALPPNTTNDPGVEGPGYPYHPTPLGLPPGARQAGDGGPPPIIKAQYAPGGRAPATAAPAAPQGGIPPLVGPGSGTIPGLGMTPTEAVAINALGKLGGVDMGLQPLLDLYYKSPEYLRLSEQEKEAGKSAVATPATMAINEAQAMNTIRTQMANEGLMIDPKTNQVVQIPGWAGAKARTADELEAVKNKYATKLQETAAEYEPVTVTQKQPDGSLVETTITKGELKRRQDMQGNRASQPGDIVGKPVETPASKFGQDLAQESYKTAQTARASLEQNNRVLKLLDDGIISGTGADSRLALQKLGAALGYTGHDRVARTEAFVASMGAEVANIIKTGKFGPPTSNVDIDFARDIAGGNIKLDEQTIRRIAAMREEVNRLYIDRHNKEFAPILQAPGSKFQATIDPPPRYGARTATGPNGQRMWDDNGTWRPM